MRQINHGIPRDNIEQQKDGAINHEGDVETDIGDKIGYCWNFVDAQKRQEGGIPECGTYVKKSHFTINKEAINHANL